MNKCQTGLLHVKHLRDEYKQREETIYIQYIQYDISGQQLMN